MPVILGLGEMMTELEFRDCMSKAMESLEAVLARAADRYGFDVDNNGGALAVSFDDSPAKFVVSPNSPVRQIWVSAHLKSSKLDWDASREEFVLGETGQSLQQLLASAIGKQLGQEVSL